MKKLKSQIKAEKYLQNPGKMNRKILTTSRSFNHPVGMVFRQFCPTREYDWIDGWKCDLLYTTTGYIEKDCIFQSKTDSALGPGIWILSQYELNDKVELIRIIDNEICLHFRIHFTDNQNKTTTVNWQLTFTGLNETGSSLVNSIPDVDPQIERAIDGLAHFLDTGLLLRG